MLGRQPKFITTMKKLFLIVVAMFAAVFFSACSDDDKADNLPITTANLAGTWQITLDEGWDTYTTDGQREYWSDVYPDVSEDNYYWTYTFDTNGVCIIKDYDDYSQEETDYCTYSIVGNTLAIKGEGFNHAGTIKKLSQSQLILFYSDEDCEYTETYKRIK